MNSFNCQLQNQEHMKRTLSEIKKLKIPKIFSSKSPFKSTTPSSLNKLNNLRIKEYSSRDNSSGLLFDQHKKPAINIYLEPLITLQESSSKSNKSPTPVPGLNKLNYNDFKDYHNKPKKFLLRLPETKYFGLFKDKIKYIGRCEDAKLNRAEILKETIFAKSSHSYGEKLLKLKQISAIIK